jgi:DNA modification methylase
MMELNKIYLGDSLELLKNCLITQLSYNFTTIFYNEKYIDDEGISADDYVDWFIPYCIEIEEL